MSKVATIDLETARRLLGQARDTQPEEFVYCDTAEGSVTALCCNVPMTDDIMAAYSTTYRARKPIPATDPRRQTGCLIGTALMLHGVSEELLTRHAIATVDTLSAVDKDLFDHEFTVRYLRTAQRVQDRGSTWHQAVESAERFLDISRSAYGDYQEWLDEQQAASTEG